MIRIRSLLVLLSLLAWCGQSALQFEHIQHDHPGELAEFACEHTHSPGSVPDSPHRSSDDCPQCHLAHAVTAAIVVPLPIVIGVVHVRPDFPPAVDDVVSAQFSLDPASPPTGPPIFA